MVILAKNQVNSLCFKEQGDTPQKLNSNWSNMNISMTIWSNCLKDWIS